MPPVVAPIVAAATAVKGAVAAAGIMKSMAVAGTALSAVGAVTKNPKLTKIGAVVGGIGTLGTMGAFGAGAKTLGMSSAAKTAAMANTAAAASSPALASSVSQGLATAPTRSAGLLRQAISSPVAAAGPAAPTTLMGKVGSALTATGKLIKGNPELATVLASGAGELASFLSGKTDAEIRDLESRIDVNDANAQQTLFAIAEEKRRRQNLNQGYLSVNPVIGLPGRQNPYQPPGLLAQNMPGVPK